MPSDWILAALVRRHLRKHSDGCVDIEVYYDNGAVLVMTLSTDGDVAHEVIPGLYVRVADPNLPSADA